MNNLKKIRKNRNISQKQIADHLGIAQNSYSRYENGTRQPDIDMLNKLADYFGVTVDEILGRPADAAPDTEPESPDTASSSTSSDNSPHWNFLDLNDPRFAPKALVHAPLPDLDRETALIPILGSVRAGYDYIAEQEMLGWLKVEEGFASLHRNAYALYVKGDSMSPKIRHNDIAICLPDQPVHNDDLAIVCINGDEGTVKRVRFEDGGLTLIPANPRYKSIHYSAEDVKTLPVIIQAKVKEVRHEYK